MYFFIWDLFMFCFFFIFFTIEHASLVCDKGKVTTSKSVYEFCFNELRRKRYCSYYLKEKFGCYETIIIIIIIGQLVHNFDPDFNLTETVGWIANFVSFMGS